METKSWLGSLWDKVKTLFTNASNTIHDLTVVADNLVNGLKNLEASQVGQFLETTVEMLIPSSIPLVNAFKLWLPVVVTDLNWAVKEEGKTDVQKVQDAVAYLQSLKLINADAYASQLNTLNALIQKWISDNQSAGLTIQQALVIPQVQHNPDLVINGLPSITEADLPAPPLAAAEVETSPSLTNVAENLGNQALGSVAGSEPAATT